MNKFAFITLSLIIISCQPAQEVVQSPFLQLCHAMDQYAETALRKGNINSIALAIYKNGEVYHNYYGEIDKGSQNPPNDQTIYELEKKEKGYYV